ncbi:MAG TPA: TRAP transporter substrate-binding protein [Bryobacteraceae bacterium]|nr:TRAP transporter substrate-binding protein [Bryobacteraceae bacterium]
MANSQVPNSNDPPLVVDASLTRRRFSVTAAAGLTLISRRARAADFSMRQYHNQPTEAPLHKRLTEMWAQVEKETHGRVHVSITPENNRMKDGDPDPLAMLQSGELEFYTVAGNGLAGLVPAADVQATPYAFRDQAQALRAMDGALGDYLREELKAKGLYAVPRGCFDNGMHQITTAAKPVRTAADLQGLKMRIPGSRLYQEFFKTFGAVTTGMNLNMLHDALKSGRVEAQDDPLDVAELFKLYEVQKYMSITNHSWSGYNLLANLKTWQALPADVQAAIERNTQKATRLQRADAAGLNRKLRGELTQRGMVFNDADTTSFRAPLGAYYARWKESIGSKATGLLEAHVGKLGV